MKRGWSSVWGESRPSPDVARVQRVHREKKGTNPCPFCVRSAPESLATSSGADQRLRRDREPPRLRPVLFRDRLLLELFRVEPLLALRFRVAAAFRADAERAALLRFADARPPRRPPFFVGALLVFRPRPEPDLRPPPDMAFSVAQARRSASSRDTPRRS